jgi:hypothetical protein
MKTLGVACAVAVLATVGGINQSAARTVNDAVPAMIVLETLPVDPALADGGVVVRGLRWSSTRIALQPARFARGIVVEKLIRGGSVLAWTAVGDVQRDANGHLMLDVPPERHAWCDVPSYDAVIAVCYQDRDGDGALETRLRGWFGAPKDPLSVSRLDSPEKIEPLSYRTAAAEELPQFRIGYESCVSKPGEQLTTESELRYSTLVRRSKEGLLPDNASAQCSEVAKLIEQREDGSGIFQFGRFKVQVSRQEDRFKTMLIEGIAPGTLIGNVRADRPLTDAVDAMSPPETSDGKPFLHAVSEPKIVGTPVPAKGELLSMEVAHGITGTLAAEARSRGWSKTITLPVGTPMYGVEMTQTSGPGSFDAEVVWCAPQRDEKGKELAWCFLRGQLGTMLESNRRPYVLQYISSSGGRGIDAPVVTRGPVDFGAPLMLRVSFERVSAKHVDLLWNVGKEPSGDSDRLRLNRGNDGRARFAVGTVIVTITPSTDGKTVAAEGGGEFKAGMLGIPMDVAELFSGR